MRYPYSNPHTLSVTACEMQRPQLSHSNMVPCYLDLRNVFSHPSQCDMKLIQVIHIVRHFESLFLFHSELKNRAPVSTSPPPCISHQRALSAESGSRPQSSSSDERQTNNKSPSSTIKLPEY